jgi:hypothetical protein
MTSIAVSAAIDFLFTVGPSPGFGGGHSLDFRDVSTMGQGHEATPLEITPYWRPTLLFIQGAVKPRVHVRPGAVAARTVRRRRTHLRRLVRSSRRRAPDKALLVFHDARLAYLEAPGFSEADIGGAGIIMRDAHVLFRGVAFDYQARKPVAIPETFLERITVSA